MSQKSCKPDSTASSSPSLLEVEDPESLSQQSQASSSRSEDSLPSLDLSPRTLVASEYLPFFRTYGRLQGEQELAAWSEVCRDQGGWSGRETPFPEDSEPPGGFFPYYRSEEESLASPAPPSACCGGSRGPLPSREAQGGCFCRMTVRDTCSVSRVTSEGWGAPGPWHAPAFSTQDPTMQDTGQVPRALWGSQSRLSPVRSTEARSRLNPSSGHG